MQIHLPTNNFAFFKTVSGSAFLATALAFPILATYSFIIALAVGKAHILGAWFAMWRSGKLNWKYVSWMCVLSVIVAFSGLKLIPSLLVLGFITQIFFSFHFLFDEFDLGEEERTLPNVVSSFGPSVLMFLALSKEFFQLNINIDIFLVIAAVFLAIEFLYTKKVTWFFVHTKALTLFVLLALFTGMSATSVLHIFLIFHYFFWFIYPVYKIHKYKPEERDGFIMILIMIVSTSVYFAVTRNSYGEEVYSLAVRAFYIGTIVHILSTAPFGYLFGLPQKKYTSVPASS